MSKKIRVEKRWNPFMEEYAYKDLESKEVYTHEEFFAMYLLEDVEIVNESEDVRNKKNPNKNKRYLS